MAESPHELEAATRARVAEGSSGRIVAGFCWPWSDPRLDGTLENDVIIADYARPWNAKPDAGKLANGIPQSHFWATDAKGIDQIGCVYTAQGFEFDYVGVIFGRDLTYDTSREEWVGRREASKDSVVASRAKDNFLGYVKNTYRVLLTRGIKGCYVCFVDESTRQHFATNILPASAANNT